MMTFASDASQAPGITSDGSGTATLRTAARAEPGKEPDGAAPTTPAQLSPRLQLRDAFPTVRMRKPRTLILTLTRL